MKLFSISLKDFGIKYELLHLTVVKALALNSYLHYIQLGIDASHHHLNGYSRPGHIWRSHFVVMRTLHSLSLSLSNTEKLAKRRQFDDMHIN